MALSMALGFVMRTVNDEEDAGGLAGARATFENASKLLELGAAPNLRGKLHPSPARARFATAG